MKKFLKILCSGILASSILLSSVNVFASEKQVVKVSIGSTVANVNGYDTTLTVAPYIQQPSDSMMIPLRFVSTGLGIDESNIQYNPNTKEITINYNGKSAKFIVGTNKLMLNGEEFSMLIENKYPVYTEIKNGSTFIPLRSLELAFGIKIDWEASTKTAILSNGNVVEKVEEVTEQVTTTPVQQIEVNKFENEETNSILEKVRMGEKLTDEDIKKMENEMIEIVNDERVKLGLNKLEISQSLMKSAKEKSKDMADNNYFSHTSPSGYNMARDLNIAENIGQQLLHEEQFESFKYSPSGHYTNIIEPNIKYIGVGFSFKLDYNNLTYDGKPTIKTYWTQQFSKDDKWANE